MMNLYNAVGFFCDDVREEKGGKMTVIGIYNDTVNVTKIPGSFAKMGLYVRVHLDVKYQVKNMSVKLRMPNGQESDISEFNIEELNSARKDAIENGNPYLGAVLQAVFAPAPIPVAGRIEAILNLDEEQIIVASLNVRERTKSVAAASTT